MYGLEKIGALNWAKNIFSFNFTHITEYSKLYSQTQIISVSFAKLTNKGIKEGITNVLSNFIKKQIKKNIRKFK